MKTSNDLIEKEGIQIVEKIGEGLVDLIEKGQMESDEMSVLLKKYLLPMVEENIDYLVLGCTHYPYLLPQIQSIIPKNIKVIDSGYAVAKQTKNILSQNNLLNDSQEKPHHIWITNGNLSVLQQFVPYGIDNLYLQKI